METTLGSDAEEVQKALSQNGITRALAKEAIEIAQEKGRFTIFAMVDALTRIAGKTRQRGRSHPGGPEGGRPVGPGRRDLSRQGGFPAGLPCFHSSSTKGGHFHAQTERETESETGSRDSAGPDQGRDLGERDAERQHVTT